MSFSKSLNEGQKTPLFTDHTNRTFSRNPKFTSRFGSAAAHLLNHDEDGNTVLKSS
jgi:hypothetical protein